MLKALNWILLVPLMVGIIIPMAHHDPYRAHLHGRHNTSPPGPGVAARPRVEGFSTTFADLVENRGTTCDEVFQQCTQVSEFDLTDAEFDAHTLGLAGELRPSFVRPVSQVLGLTKEEQARLMLAYVKGV